MKWNFNLVREQPMCLQVRCVWHSHTHESENPGETSTSTLVSILTVSLSLKWCLIQFHLLFSSAVLMCIACTAAVLVLCVNVRVFLRKTLCSSPYLKDISWMGLSSLNNKALTENIYLLLELQYAISFCTRRGKAGCSETTLGYFPPCNV